MKYKIIYNLEKVMYLLLKVMFLSQIWHNSLPLLHKLIEIKAQSKFSSKIKGAMELKKIYLNTIQNQYILLTKLFFLIYSILCNF